MGESDLRPPVWVGHIHFTTDKLAESHDFMVELGMRSIVKGDDFAVLELRAGTHLILQRGDVGDSVSASFDLMVENLDTTHEHLRELGAEPSEISGGRIHRSFQVRDPSGQMITFNSSHASDQPI